MKKYCLLIIALTLIFSFGIAFAQPRTDGPEGSEYKDSSPGLSGYNLGLGLDVGTVFLHSDRDAGLDTGIGFGTHLDYFIDDFFALNFALGYSHHSGGGGMNNFFIDIGPRARLPIDPIAPFISISPGFVWQSFGSPVNDSAVSFALDFGTGLDLMVSDHVTMGLGYKYHLVFDRNTSVAGVGTADFMSLMLKIDYVF